ncbi:hypothetical protein DRN79_00285 [Methanosarcinales archaeon]|nr:MAG: hypothetical protein DRN79_00285 [Methanosarcinales archaeon]
MGVAEILERIRASAEEERQRIISDAKRRAEEMIENTKTSLEKHKNQVLAREERRGEEEKARIIRSARLEARRIRWAAEEELTQQIFEEAERRLNIVREKGFAGIPYNQILANLIKEAAMSIAYIETHPQSSPEDTIKIEVLLSEQDADFIDDDILSEISEEIAKETGVKTQITVAPERIKSLGGVVVRREDGKVEVNNTYEKRLERLMPLLRERVAKILWT